MVNIKKGSIGVNGDNSSTTGKVDDKGNVEIAVKNQEQAGDTTVSAKVGEDGNLKEVSLKVEVPKKEDSDQGSKSLSNKKNTVGITIKEDSLSAETLGFGGGFFQSENKTDLIASLRPQKLTCQYQF